LLAPINSDFLAAALMDDCAPQADALILCGINDDRTGRNNFGKMRYHQQITPYDSVEWDYLQDVDLHQDMNRWCGVSHIQQHLPEAWGRASGLVNAKLVLIDGSKSFDSLVTDDFVEGGHYQVAIGNEERIPRISFGIAASNAFLPQLQAQVSS